MTSVDEMAANRERMRATMTTELTKVADIHGEAGSAVHEARSAMHDAASKANNTAIEAVNVMNDNRIYPDGRHEAVNDMLSDTSKYLDRSEESADAHLAVAEAFLTNQALPTVADGDRDVARTDARMMLDNASPSEMIGKLTQLAMRDDSVGGLVMSDWIGDYLASRGVDQRTAKEWVSTARDAAIARRATGEVGSSHPERQKAAADLQNVKRLRSGVKAIVGSFRSNLDPRPKNDPVL